MSELINMSKINVLKARIAYLTIWVGMMVITDISLIGWIIGNFNTSTTQLIFGSIVIVIAITISATIIHRQINKHIIHLGEL